jgi:hypothetical protein
MKWENFGAFLSWLLRREVFLTGFFLSEFHCNSLGTAPGKDPANMATAISVSETKGELQHYSSSSLKYIVKFVWKASSQWDIWRGKGGVKG